MKKIKTLLSLPLFAGILLLSSFSPKQPTTAKILNYAWYTPAGQFVAWSTLANAEVVDTAILKSTRIIFGAHVELQDIENDEKVKYQIVGEDESDVKNGKISVFSPMARSLIGKSKGDVIEVRSPKGEKEFEVLNFYFK